MRRYESYKDSGVEWLGEVPSHWEVENSKRVFSYRKDKAEKTDEQLTSSQKYGVIPQNLFMDLEGRRVTVVEFNYEILKHVEKGDFVISMRSFQGGIEYCNYTGCVSSAYVALIPTSKVHSQYYRFLLKSGRYIEALQSTSNLVRDGQALRYENFCMVPLIVPPLSEQQKIAQFLDDKTAKIDQAVDLAEKQIALLKEHKQILIQNTVTRGLNPDVPLKDSSVEWIGQVPEHWEKYPLFVQAKISSITNHIDKELLSVYLDRGVIRFSDVDEKRTNVTSLDLSKYQLVRKGNFVLNNQQAWRGSVGISNYEGIVSPAYLILELSNKFESNYANYLFRNGTMVAHYFVASKGVGSIQRNLYWGNLRRTPIFIPPLSEQQRIADYLNTQTAKIDQAIALKTAHIEKLKEYKSVLINDVVTGKVRV
ncbi:TPA: restriction endonuclease subunit S [Haemophilus influenzae]